MTKLYALGVYTAENAPEIADGAHIFAARHHSFVGVSDQWGIFLYIDPTLGKFFFQDGFHYFFTGSGGNGGLHQHHAMRLDQLAQSAHSFTEMCEVAISLLRFAKSRFGGIKLNINHHHVCKCVNKFFAGGAQSLLFHHGTMENLGHFRV